jgi:FtsH-binding integral membrane protein
MYVLQNKLERKGFKMKSKLVLGFILLLVFGFSSMVCYAQSSSNEQRIVGTWVYTSINGLTRTYVFNANGSGTVTEAQGGETGSSNFTYGFSVTGEIMSDNGPMGRVYFSPDGRTLFLDNSTPYRKR